MLSSTVLREDKEMENSPAASASCFRWEITVSRAFCRDLSWFSRASR